MDEPRTHGMVGVIEVDRGGFEAAQELALSKTGKTRGLLRRSRRAGKNKHKDDPLHDSLRKSYIGRGGLASETSRSGY